MSTNPSSKPNLSASATEEPYQDDPVPSYEAAVQQGASGSMGAGPSVSSSAPAHTNADCHPAYGCSPYTPHGTARIVIVPAPQLHYQQHYSHLPHPRHYSHLTPAQAQNQPLLPVPATMHVHGTPAQRARRRFVVALLHAFFIYMLINILLGFTMSSKW